MFRATVCAAFAALLLPGAAAASGKCGDDLYEKGKRYWVTWAVPLPKGAVVRSDDDAAQPPRGAGDADTDPDGAEILRTADSQKIDKWYYDHKVAKTPGRPILDGYLKDGYEAYFRIVSHETVPDPVSFTRCSCVRQDADIEYVGGKETIRLRSTFRSRRENDTGPADFRPRALQIEFQSPGAILFPLRFAELAPTSVNLEIRVRRGTALDLSPVPPSLQTSTRQTAGGDLVVTISGDLPKAPTADLRIPVR